MNYPNGDTYDGEWRSDNKDGRGVMEYSNGTKYDGDWVYDLPCTKGNFV